MSASSAQGRWFSANLRLFAGLLLMLIVLFTAARFWLVTQVRSAGDATAAELARAYIVGLRFDASVACMLLIPFIVLSYLPWTNPWRGPRARRLYVLGLTLTVATALFLLVAEVEFFREFQTRYNQLAITYLDHPQIVGSMIWYNYPVVRYLLAGLAGAVALYFAFGAAVRWAGRAKARLTARPRSSGRHAALVEILGAAGVVAAIVVGARGGVQSEPLRWGDAFRGQNEFASQMGLNGLWCLFQAARDANNRGDKSKGWDNSFPVAQARDVVRQSLMATGESSTDPADRTDATPGKPRVFGHSTYCFGQAGERRRRDDGKLLGPLLRRRRRAAIVHPGI